MQPLTTYCEAAGGVKLGSCAFPCACRYAHVPQLFTLISERLQLHPSAIHVEVTAMKCGLSNITRYNLAHMTRP